MNLVEATIVLDLSQFCFQKNFTLDTECIKDFHTGHEQSEVRK